MNTSILTVKDVEKQIENAQEESTSFIPLASYLADLADRLKASMNKVIESMDNFESIYNKTYLKEYKTKSGIQRLIAEKIERGYVDDK